MEDQIKLILLLIFMLLNTTIARPRRQINSQCKSVVRYGFFDGKDFLTFDEYIKNFEKGGYKLNPIQVYGAKIDFERNDQNRNGLLDLDEAIDHTMDKSAYLRKFEIFDQNKDGFLSWSEIEDYLRFWHHFGIFYQVKSELKYHYQNGSREDLIGPDNQLDLDEFQKWGLASIAKCLI